MRSIRIKNLGFGSHLKICILGGVCAGIPFGILFFILLVLGMPANAYLGESTVAGIRAAVMGIVLFPLAYGFMGFWIGLLSFLPFKLLFLKLGRGLAVNAEFYEEQSYYPPNPPGYYQGAPYMNGPAYPPGGQQFQPGQPPVYPPQNQQFGGVGGGQSYPPQGPDGN